MVEPDKCVIVYVIFVDFTAFVVVEYFSFVFSLVFSLDFSLM